VFTKKEITNNKETGQKQKSRSQESEKSHPEDVLSVDDFNFEQNIENGERELDDDLLSDSENNTESTDVNSRREDGVLSPSI